MCGPCHRPRRRQPRGAARRPSSTCGSGGCAHGSIVCHRPLSALSLTQSSRGTMEYKSDNKQRGRVSIQNRLSIRTKHKHDNSNSQAKRHRRRHRSSTSTRRWRCAYTPTPRRRSSDSSAATAKPPKVRMACGAASSEPTCTGLLRAARRVVGVRCGAGG